MRHGEQDPLQRSDPWQVPRPSRPAIPDTTPTAVESPTSPILNDSGIDSAWSLYEGTTTTTAEAAVAATTETGPPMAGQATSPDPSHPRSGRGGSATSAAAGEGSTQMTTSPTAQPSYSAMPSHGLPPPLPPYGAGRGSGAPTPAISAASLFGVMRRSQTTPTLQSAATSQASLFSGAPGIAVSSQPSHPAAVTAQSVAATVGRQPPGLSHPSVPSATLSMLAATQRARQHIQAHQQAAIANEGTGSASHTESVQVATSAAQTVSASVAIQSEKPAASSTNDQGRGGSATSAAA